jgi:uncharacterized protein YecE (DUF72 family)
MAGRIVVGTSSWADPGFVEDWYPPGLPARDRLAWYAERFEAVELNSSFYALPSRRTTARWVELTPAGFLFHVKLHRLLSRHAAPLDSLPPDLRDEARTNERGRVLLDPALERALAARLLEEVAPLAQAGRLGAFLLQLSPAFTPDRHELGELAGVTEALAPWPVAVELRHRAWVATRRRERTLAELEALGAAFVGVDSPQGRNPMMMPPLDAVTRDDLAYLRAHGRNAHGFVHGRSVAERFGWVYSDEELQELAGRAAHLAEQVPSVQMMFNNNRGSDAPRAARRFRELIGQDPGPAPARDGAPAQGALT